MVAGATTTAAAAVPAIAVIAARPGACPDAPSVERSLARLSAGGAAAPTGWTLALEPGEPAPAPSGAPPLRVVLRDPAGAPALERALPPGAASCEAAAEAVALIVERYFREVAWTAGTPAPAPLEIERAAPPPRTSAAVAPGAEPAAPSSPPPTPRLALSAGTALWSRQPAPLAIVEARARVGRRVSVALAAVAPPARRTEALPRGGDVRLEAWPLLVRAAGHAGGGDVTWRAGLDGLVTFERGEAPAALADAAPKRRTVLALGASAGAEVAIAPRWRLVVEAAGYRSVLGRSFVVNGAAGEEARVLEPPALQVIVAARLGWVVAP